MELATCPPSQDKCLQGASPPSILWLPVDDASHFGNQTKIDVLLDVDTKIGVASTEP